MPQFGVYFLSVLISYHDSLEWGIRPAVHVSLDLGGVMDFLGQGDELGCLLLPLDTSKDFGPLVKCNRNIEVGPCELLSDHPLATIFFKDLLNILDETIKLSIELLKGCLLLVLIWCKFHRHRGLSELGTEVDNGITLSHLHIILAGNPHLSCYKSGDGIGLHQNFVVPSQLRHESALGRWLNLRPFLHLDPFVLKFNSAIAEDHPDDLSPSTTVKVQQLNFRSHFGCLNYFKYRG